MLQLRLVLAIVSKFALNGMIPITIVIFATIPSEFIILSTNFLFLLSLFSIVLIDLVFKNYLSVVIFCFIKLTANSEFHCGPIIDPCFSLPAFFQMLQK